VSVISDFDTADKIYNLTQTAERAVAAKQISEIEASAWLVELRAATQCGFFAAALTAYIVVGRKLCEESTNQSCLA
jgi:hypothetical protein